MTGKESDPWMEYIQAIAEDVADFAMQWSTEVIQMPRKAMPNGKMPPKGMHRMKSGMMMSDAEMTAKMSGPKTRAKKAASAKKATRKGY